MCGDSKVQGGTGRRRLQQWTATAEYGPRRPGVWGGNPVITGNPAFRPPRQTRGRKDTQSKDTQTQRQADAKTRRRNDTPTNPFPRQTQAQANPLSQTDTQTQRYADAETQRRTDAQTQRRRDAETHRRATRRRKDAQTQTRRRVPSSACPPSRPRASNEASNDDPLRQSRSLTVVRPPRSLPRAWRSIQDKSCMLRHEQGGF